MELKNFTLLFVEDDPTTQMMMKDLLGEEVRDFYQANNGKEGLELFREKLPDIVITDISMPIMDGLEMAEAIKKIDSSVPIIIMSAFDDKEILFKAIEIGIDGFLPKPIDISQLFRLCKKVADNLGKIRLAETMLRYKMKELEDRANYDRITRLANRHNFEQALNESVEACERFHHWMGLILIDLDNFKAINDSFGHPAGDEVLRTLSRRIQEVVPDRNKVFRIGGDEFAVILTPLLSIQTLENLAKRLAQICSFNLKEQDRIIPVQCSVGACSYPTLSHNRKELLSHADQALYRAKEGGKGVYRICR